MTIKLLQQLLLFMQALLCAVTLVVCLCMVFSVKEKGILFQYLRTAFVKYILVKMLQGKM